MAESFRDRPVKFRAPQMEVPVEVTGSRIPGHPSTVDPWSRLPRPTKLTTCTSPGTTRRVRPWVPGDRWKAPSAAGPCPVAAPPPLRSKSAPASAPPKLLLLLARPSPSGCQSGDLKFLFSSRSFQPARPGGPTSPGVIHPFILPAKRPVDLPLKLGCRQSPPPLSGPLASQARITPMSDSRSRTLKAVTSHCILLPD